VSDTKFPNPVVSSGFLRSIHWTGAPQRIRRLTPSASGAADGPADMVVLTATPAQCRDQEWRKVIIGEAMAAMASGALLYAFVPPTWRLALAHAFRRRGFVVGENFVHFVDGAGSIYVPLKSNSLRFALTEWPRSRMWWPVTRLLETVPKSSDVLAAILPSVGFIAHQRNISPFAWLLNHLSDLPVPDMVVATSWRGDDGATLIFALDRDRPEPLVIAKRAPPGGGAAARHEAAMLVQLGPAVEQAGMRVPRLLTFTETCGIATLLESALPGRPFSHWIAENQCRFDRIVDELSAWLARWHRRTVEYVELTPPQCEHLILSPARSLANLLDGGSAYVERLAAASTRLLGKKVPFVSAHNDLTMANIRGGRDGCTGLVDWEAALPQGLPLADFWYAACDAATAMSDGDRLSSFKRCFGENEVGVVRSSVLASENRLRAVVGGPGEWIDLCFHGCWLQHAANEHARRESERNPSFLAIANALSQSTAMVIH
jgi:hypothetical protein